MIGYETTGMHDFQVFSDSIEQIDIGSNCVVNTLNQYSYVVAGKDERFKQALIQSDILLPDGISIVKAIKFLKGEKIKKIAGWDIHIHLLKKLDENAGRCFYLGSNENTLVEIKKRLAFEYPSIKMGFYSPSFKPIFDEVENSVIINEVNCFLPNVLFVGMTAPKQEKWVQEYKGLLNVKTICSIGAVFDFYAGTVPRAGNFWIKLGLEWFIRLVKNPKRMWRRYLYYGPIFVYKIFLIKVNANFKSTKQLIIPIPDLSPSSVRISQKEPLPENQNI
jgi:N-acetylglucosaminyldiphosphoundecaprenol N-acetyl-beta-D-mannosaminyltransferase